MELTNHSLHDLFLQLGLPGSEDEIEAFIATHGPLPEDVRLSDASFWSPAQAQFLKEAIQRDADWVEMVDQLNLRLH